MKNPVAVGLMLGAVVCFAYGCGSDDDDDTSPNAGAAGKAGSGGKAGAAGTSGKGGKGGTAGKAGSGGDSGGGGVEDNGGAPTNEGGNGATCPNERPSDDLASCPAGADTVTTTCTFEDTCHALDCGGTWALFDSSGCQRPRCTASSACESTERCASPVLLGDTTCYPSTYEKCGLTNCLCGCTPSADCTHPSFCQAETVLPATYVCPVASFDCTSIGILVTGLESYTKGLDTGDLSDTDTAIIACEADAKAKADACSNPGTGGTTGQGGEGGQSGAGPSSGGQAGG